MSDAHKPVSIYAAGPLGFSEAGRHFYETVFLPMLKQVGFEVIDPWVLTEQSIIEKASSLPYGEEQRQAWIEANKIIARNNMLGIDRSQIVVAVLDGTDVDSGTAAEIGYAAKSGIPVIGYRGDFRLSADNPGSTVNLQVQFFVELHGGVIATKINDLRDVLILWYEKLSKPE